MEKLSKVLETFSIKCWELRINLPCDDFEQDAFYVYYKFEDVRYRAQIRARRFDGKKELNIVLHRAGVDNPDEADCKFIDEGVFFEMFTEIFDLSLHDDHQRLKQTIRVREEAISVRSYKPNDGDGVYDFATIDFVHCNLDDDDDENVFPTKFMRKRTYIPCLKTQEPLRKPIIHCSDMADKEMQFSLLDSMLKFAESNHLFGDQMYTKLVHSLCNDHIIKKEFILEWYGSFNRKTRVLDNISTYVTCLEDE